MTKSKKRIAGLASSIVAIIVCSIMLIGTTFAWFTDSTSSNGNVIASGLLDVNAYWSEATNDPTDQNVWTELDDGAVFDYDNWEPGYVSAKHLMVANEGTLAFKYKMLIVPAGEASILADVIDVYYFNDATMLGARSNVENGVLVGTLADMIADPDGAAYGILLPEGATPNNQAEVVGSKAITIALKMQEDAGVEYQNLSIGTNFEIKVVATQYAYEEDTFGNDYDENSEYPKTWDGTADTSWYNENDVEFKFDAPEQLAGFAELVDAGNDFAGKTIKLEADMNLFKMGAGGEPISFDPIGDDSPFRGTFDGDGHKIENLYQSGWAFGYEWGSYGSIGLFGELDGATVKNVTISGAETFVEGGDVAGIAGSATGDCTFENITIQDSDIATYNNGLGGIIGWSGAGNYTFRNITIAEDVVLGGLWGSFDSSIGGIVGQAEPGATYVFENVNVACRIDAYNDCTASYDYYNYRMCGMLIGRLEETTTIDGVNYPDTSKYNITCNNVTVTYGEWSDYHYCRAEGARAKRVQAGYQYGGIAADYDHSVCTVHHMELIPFDQIFGGDQYGVKGLKTYDGVKVVYDK